MKKTLLMSMLALLALPAVVHAADGGHVYYKNGTRLEFPDAGFKLKLNVQLQQRLTFKSWDESEARGLDDELEFRTRRARLEASGSAVDGKVSFRLQNDFAGKFDSEGRRASDLKDAWLQLNMDDASFRMGQFKVPFSRQENVSSAKLQFLERSIANNRFDHDRNNGAMLHGDMAGLDYALAVVNGESTGEGRNRGAVDTNVLGALQVSTTDGDYNRGQESYPGEDGSGWTAGAAVAIGEGTNAAGDFDSLSLNGDVGFRSGGTTVQAEYYYDSTDPSGGGSSIDDTGLYVQAGTFIAENCEIAGRYSAIFGDSSGSDTDLTEYSIVLNHYLKGHSVKMQLGVTFLETDNPAGTKDTDDMFVDFQIGAYI